MVEWLNQYINIKQNIEVLKIDIEMAELEIERWDDGDLSKGQSFDVAIKKQLDLSHHIQNKREVLNQYIEKKEKIEELVERFDGIHNLIAKEKYINGKSLLQIAMDHNYSEQYIYNKHVEVKCMIKFSQPNQNLT